MSLTFDIRRLFEVRLKFFFASERTKMNSKLLLLLMSLNKCLLMVLAHLGTRLKTILRTVERSFERNGNKSVVLTSFTAAGIE